MPLKRKGGNVLTDHFLLTDNPFASIDIYNVDVPHTYVPEVYGKHLTEFYEKFFILPLENDQHHQVIGALWSSHEGNQWGKGFGKSMLMAEESKGINQDLGASMLRKMDVEDEAIAEHPVLAGYCTFDQSKGITLFSATLLDAVAFILGSACGEWNVHMELRARILSDLGSTGGYDEEAICRALMRSLRAYSGLNVQLSHHMLTGFMNRLAGEDTDDLISFIRHEIGPRIKASQGFNFVHVFNAFAKLAGIIYIVYFIDQIENFARFVRPAQMERDMKIVREAMRQTSPTAEMASFIFQMHVHAQQEIERWWQLEDLPSLMVGDPRSQARIVSLNGLGSKEAQTLSERYLADFRPDGVVSPTPLFPFSEEIIEAVRETSHGNPRDFLRKLGEILDNARVDGRKSIDLTYVEPLLGQDFGEEEETDDDDSFVNPTR